MTSAKYIGMDVHKESISIAVRNDAGKIVMESVIETRANAILDFIHGLRGELQITFEEGTWDCSRRVPIGASTQFPRRKLLCLAAVMLLGLSVVLL